jgi:hypothetical protein
MTSLYVIEPILKNCVALRLKELAEKHQIRGFVFDIDVEHAKTLSGAELVAHLRGLRTCVKSIKDSQEAKGVLSETDRLIREYCRFRLFSAADYRDAARAWQRTRRLSRGVRLIFSAA